METVLRFSSMTAKAIPLIHHGFGKLSVLIPGPEQHFLPFLRPHVARLPGRVDIQSVKPGSMIENGAKLIVNGLKVSF